MNADGWKLAVGGAIAHATGDHLVGPLPSDTWWILTAAILGTAAVLCWRGTVDTDNPRAKAAVQTVQLPFLVATFAFVYWVTTWLLAWLVG